ncbi:generic peroxidase [Auricularia subglabra TFB-10046 SS5]|uniref:Peroxidase n=1 Tax=Auricularia subglabra (strain TFB-10046 / SS5) TaxID=717982 RepID=J0WWS9_AURST|nr:generic peroxidase [Auricularia subglabra TFB-10046 SS5]
MVRRSSQSVRNWLNGLITAGVINIGERATRRPVKCPGNNHYAQKAQCCVWYDVLDDIQENLFDGGKCGAEAHESLRLSFHDPIGYSVTSNLLSFGRKNKCVVPRGVFVRDADSLSRAPGGADGSIIAFADIELEYAGNAGLADIADDQKNVADDHKVSYGDIIQFAGAVALANCPGSPRIQFLAGRPNATVPAPQSSLPSPFDSVPKILLRLADATFTPAEVVALMASHSLGGQKNVDKSKSGYTFDTTPDKLDSQFFLETLLKGTEKGRTAFGTAPAPVENQIRLQSDYALARHPLTSCTWQSYINNQKLMSTQFGKAMEKLAVLGQRKASLYDCSEVIPTPAAYNTPATYPAGKSSRDIEASLTTLDMHRTSKTPWKGY